jgi:UDP-2,3-diacylglucosamine hydrolase
MTAIFLSDVHLRDSSSVKSQLVIRFLQKEATQFERIYILGDLFDIWPGTSAHLIKTFGPVVESLKRLVNEGHVVHYIEGNHDFLLGEYFTKELGIHVHRDAATETWNGKRIYMTHGDMANPKDVGYRALRYILRNKLFQSGLKILPQEFVFTAGLKSSQLSRTFQRKVTRDEELIRDIYREGARDILKQGYDVIIMGHTHLPEDIPLVVDGRECRYINTGDWIKNFTYVEYDGVDFHTKVHPVRGET